MKYSKASAKMATDSDWRVGGSRSMQLIAKDLISCFGLPPTADAVQYKILARSRQYPGATNAKVNNQFR